jgi:hypothetical protein
VLCLKAYTISHQLVENHLPVPPKAWTGKALQFPTPDEIPNIDMEIMNFHTPMLGTFHAKYVLADREIGIVCSNNIQTNANMEMMVHYEGPIVASLYDMALISWDKKLDPPMITSAPVHENPPFPATIPPAEPTIPQDGEHPVAKTNQESDSQVPVSNEPPLPEHTADDPHWDDSIAAEIKRVQAQVSGDTPEARLLAVTKHLSKLI